MVPRKFHNANAPGNSLPRLSARPASTLSTAGPSPFKAAVMQKANSASAPTSAAPPPFNCCAVSFGVIPSAGTSASPARSALMNAVISSQPRKLAMNASGSTCTIARLRGCFRFANSAMSVMCIHLISPVLIGGHAGTRSGMCKWSRQSPEIMISGISAGSGMSSPSSSASRMPVTQTSPSSITSLMGASRSPWQGPMKQWPVSRSNWA